MVTHVRSHLVHRRDTTELFNFGSPDPRFAAPDAPLICTLNKARANFIKQESRAIGKKLNFSSKPFWSKIFGPILDQNNMLSLLMRSLLMSNDAMFTQCAILNTAKTIWNLTKKRFWSHLSHSGRFLFELN